MPDLLENRDDVGEDHDFWAI